MAGAVAQGLRDRVRARVGKPSESGLETVDIYAWLNEAQHELIWRLNDGAIPEMTAIATGVLTNSRVALPTLYWRDWLLQIGTTDKVATRWDVTELDALDNNTLTLPAADNPYYFVWYHPTDAAVRLQVDISSPTSTDAYDLYYVKTPTDMSDSVDPVLTAEKHELLLDFAVIRYREQRGEYPEAQRIWNGYIAKINAWNSRYAPGSRHEGGAGDAN